MATRYPRSKTMKIPYSTLLQAYYADLRIRNLSPNTIAIYAKNLRYPGEFLLREQPQAELLLENITPERVKAYVAHRMSLKQVWANHPSKPTQERPL